jgi:hypothetical protein
MIIRTEKQMNGRRIKTIQTPTGYLCISKPVQPKEKIDIFKELGIARV